MDTQLKVFDLRHMEMDVQIDSLAYEGLVDQLRDIQSYATVTNMSPLIP